MPRQSSSWNVTRYSFDCTKCIFNNRLKGASTIKPFKNVNVQTSDKRNVEKKWDHWLCCDTFTILCKRKDINGSCLMEIYSEILCPLIHLQLSFIMKVKTILHWLELQENVIWEVETTQFLQNWIQWKCIHLKKKQKLTHLLNAFARCTRYGRVSYTQHIGC